MLETLGGTVDFPVRASGVRHGKRWRTITDSKIESYNTVVKAIRIRSLSECNYTVLTLLMGV
jgi:hypothetical protein